MVSLHEKNIVIDGLIIANWSKAVFQDMRKGGVTAANCTVSVWEDFKDTCKNIAQMNKHIVENADMLLKVKTVEDIRRAKREDKTGIILGFQNSYALEDQIGYVKLFKDMGVGIIQMAYNTQNLICTGCYEQDGGLSDFGREIVDVMNKVGIAIDLSHVGPKSANDIIEYSKMPVCYSHCLPSGLKNHPRNKSDEQLKFIANHNGFVGVTMFSPFLKNGVNSTIDDYVEAIDYIINIVGEDNVGIGTDFTQDYGRSFFEWITHDKGYARKLTEFGEVVNPEGMRLIGDFPNLTEALVKNGWGEQKIEKIIGNNWFNFLETVWHN